MLRATIASLRGHKRRVVGMCSAVVLGVAFLSGTLVLGDTMRAGFGDLFGEANEDLDVLVRSSNVIEAGEGTERGPVDDSLVDEIAAVDGVAAAVPSIEGTGEIVGSDGEPLGGGGPPTVAGNWVTDKDLNPYTLDEGRAPESPMADASGGDAPYEVVIDRGSARNGDLQVGDQTMVRVPDPIDVTVVGIATFGERDSLGPVTFVGFTTEAAQDLLMPQPGTLTGVLVSAAPGTSPDELVSTLEQELPDGVDALTGEALTQEQREDIESDFLGFLETALLVFAGIALVVATFSIYNTFSIVVAQRTRESALLRALGASRRQVLGSVVVEAVVIGLVASALGAIAGIGLSRGLVGLFNAVDLELPTTRLVVESGSLIISVIVGLIVTLLAGVIPAVKSSRVRPMAALRDVAIDRTSGRAWRAVAGPVVVGAGAALVIVGSAVAGDLMLTGLGALLMVIGMVLFGPLVARPVSAVLGAPLGGLRGMSGKLARANAMRNPTRTSSTATALMVGVAVVGMFTVLAASLRTYIRDTMEASFQGDLVIMTANWSGSGLSPELAPAIGNLPEVEMATGMGSATVQLGDSGRWATTVDGDQLAQTLDIGVSKGSLEELTDGTVAISESFAEDKGWSLGSTVPASFVDGSERGLTVAVIYEDPDMLGHVVLPVETSELDGIRQTVDVVSINLAEGVDVDDARAAVQPVADRFSAPEVQDGQELAESEAAEIDQVLTVIYAILALAVIIAFLNIATTLSLSIHERTRELGLLRAVGQSRRQLRSMVRGESLLVALFGTVSGLGLACFLGWALTTTLAEAEDVAIPLNIPVGQFAVLLVLGGVAGMLAATRPARRAAKLDVLQAIATE